ncbi:hypothetical protein [Enterobacter sp. CPE_E1214]|uniref:hypothetical protein n=1 Tax=unclassified Enterobacter TaxID=2608935 RepID=UPI0038901813
MKRSDADVISQKSYSSAETRNTVSHLQAAESLHEISVKTPTLRDYFAAKFAVVYIGNCYSHPALDAYKMADKMLEARNMSTEDIEAYEKKLAEDMGEDIPW